MKKKKPETLQKMLSVVCYNFFLNIPECSVKLKVTIFYLLDYIGLNEILKSGNWKEKPRNTVENFIGAVYYNFSIYSSIFCKT